MRRFSFLANNPHRNIGNPKNRAGISAVHEDLPVPMYKPSPRAIRTTPVRIEIFVILVITIVHIQEESPVVNPEPLELYTRMYLSRKVELLRIGCILKYIANNFLRVPTRK